ncbi:hypothetical protein CA234_08595 [Sphingomonas sp. ABOLE]|jgi:hypothetical protein|uniref:hypothetical protein n=1 Tax=Sphingomonas sp. ABOLE TaxID=1985878 RepID=UPI000F7DF14A|nr:hypothetical protein [Sphingomonas sp. ABOLE]RSV41731.1 hypothetical protein CA234_08595 [Sphingomonas sp. ABOLE]
MFHQADLFDQLRPSRRAMDTPMLLATIAGASQRPKFAYMLLQLIAEIADEKGQAGPSVAVNGAAMPVRDWLCDGLVPMAQRDARRRSTVQAVREDLEKSNALPVDATKADLLIEQKVRERVRRSGRCNVSRAVSDLVRAGLLRRHYQGYRVDHENRGAQREAVYTIVPDALAALRR